MPDEDRPLRRPRHYALRGALCLSVVAAGAGIVAAAGMDEPPWFTLVGMILGGVGLGFLAWGAVLWMLIRYAPRVSDRKE